MVAKSISFWRVTSSSLATSANSASLLFFEALGGAAATADVAEGRVDVPGAEALLVVFTAALPFLAGLAGLESSSLSERSAKDVGVGLEGW
ncbi:hypothetical protein C8R45DRAFT_405844 [Mycena sanguinolenta]|nr:hypothetical protein C8R45DRAFT_405844 [Mycena sanguinolenta]